MERILIKEHEIVSSKGKVLSTDQRTVNAVTRGRITPALTQAMRDNNIFVAVYEKVQTSKESL